MARGIYVGVNILPTDYTPLEYIQSTGTQYINTYFYPEYTTRVVMDAQIATIGTAAQALFGARNASYQRAFAFMYSTSGPAFTSFFGSTTSQRFTTKDFTAKLSIDKDKRSCSLNSESMTHTSETFYSAYYLYLMASNEANTAKHFASMRLYSCQIYHDGTLRKNLIPCKNASGTVGLYDSVNQVFHTNAGSGNFIAGPVLTNRPGVARKVEKVYLGVNGVARKIARGYVGVNGVARCVFPNTIKWEKWTAESVSGYEEVGQYDSRRLTSSASYYETFYDDYEFSTTDGVTMIGESDYLMPDEVDAIVGLYLEGTTSDGNDAVYVITESGYLDDGRWYYNYETALVYESADTWESTDYIGEVEADEGELPEDGELVDGDVDGFYCVLYFPGDGYYYYERMTT